MKSPVEPAARLHFCVPTPQGALFLDLPARHGRDAVGAALAVRDAEGWLTALEQGLALVCSSARPFSLDPAPQPGAPAAQAGLVWCRSAGDAACVDRIRVGLPWQMLAQAAALNSLDLEGPAQVLHVDVERWAMPPSLPLSPPQAGGLLLLPTSFESPWRVTLVARELGLEVDALWAGPGHPPRLAGAPRAAVQAGAGVRLQDTLLWPLAALLGGCPAPQTALSGAAQGWVDGAGGAAAVACSGRIVPALGGAGLLVSDEHGLRTTQAGTPDHAPAEFATVGIKAGLQRAPRVTSAA